MHRLSEIYQKQQARAYAIEKVACDSVQQCEQVNSVNFIGSLQRTLLDSHVFFSFLLQYFLTYWFIFLFLAATFLLTIWVYLCPAVA